LDRAGLGKGILFILMAVGLAGASGCNSYTVANNAVPAPSPTTDQSVEKTANESFASPAEAEPKPSQTPTQFEEPDVKAATDIIRQYYAAINAGNFRKAYELWSEKGEASKKSFEEFRSGFAETSSVTVDIGKPGDMEGAAGSRYITIPVTIRAKLKNGKEQNFAGEYVLRRSVVDGATAEQRAWRIYSANINQK
jgi:hypothetical protein